MLPGMNMLQTVGQGQDFDSINSEQKILNILTRYNNHQLSFYDNLASLNLSAFKPYRPQIKARLHPYACYT